MQVLLLIVVLVLIAVMTSNGQMMGGWRPVDVHDAQVVQTAQFAVESSADFKGSMFVVLDANKQVSCVLSR
jgi:hypothetical protein